MVQRLEKLEQEQPSSGNPNEDEDEDEAFIPANSKIPGGDLSHILNESLFHDGISASQRQWAAQSNISGAQRWKVLNDLAQNFLQSEPAPITTQAKPEITAESEESEQQATPSSFSVEVIFEVIFEGVTTRATTTTTTIYVDPFDKESTVKNKILAKFGLSHNSRDYCLRHLNLPIQNYCVRIDSWRKWDYDVCQSRRNKTGPVLGIQKNFKHTSSVSREQDSTRQLNTRSAKFLGMTLPW
jgi:hypothetical protein